MIKKDNFRDVPGFDGLYSVSIETTEGRCINTKTGKELSVTPNKGGRIYWCLYKDGKAQMYQAARWIALTYPELIQNEWFDGAEIDHINTVRTDNRPENLRWVSSKENTNNPLTKIHQSEGQINRPDHSKWVIKLTKDDEILHFYPSVNQAERETGILHTSIINCLKGRSSTAGNYKWKYAE